MEQYIPPTIVFLLSYSKNHRSFKNHLKSFFPRSASFTHAIPRVHDLWNKIYRTLEISVYKLKLSIQFFPRKVLANSSHDIFRNHGNCPLYIYIAELLNFQTHNKLLVYIYIYTNETRNVRTGRKFWMIDRRKRMTYYIYIHTRIRRFVELNVEVA